MTPAKQLDSFLAKFTPEVARTGRAILARLKKRVPGANQLVYDNYNALAIGFAPGERAGEVVLSVALFPRWVSVFFFAGGPKLPDPHKLLKGHGTTTRHIVVEDPARLDDPRVAALISEVLKRADPPIDPKAKGKLLIKSISAKQRPRRPAEPKLRATKKRAPRSAPRRAP